MDLGATYLGRVWAGSQLSTRLLPAAVRPLSAHIKLTENCQARCISCDYWKTRWHDAIDTARAIELVDEIAAVGIQSLRFTGGEPLLRKDLFHVLQKANTSSFRRIILQTNGLLIKKLHQQINASPITNVCVSIDGLKETNDLIRGIRGYFDLAVDGIQLLRDKRVSFSVTLNRMSAEELEKLAQLGHSLGANIEFNILSQSLYFLKDADLKALWPESASVDGIAKFLRKVVKRPAYEVDYITRYYNRKGLVEPACVLGFLQVFVISNGDVLTGCYPLAPVGNILRDKLKTILSSKEYRRQCEAMIRRECPGCTCGVESSLAMKHAVSRAFFEIGSLIRGANNNAQRPSGRLDEVEAVSTLECDPDLVSISGTPASGQTMK
jgi:MoaA/NifB/PqqE/SkfB family radical SAM enzyme